MPGKQMAIDADLNAGLIDETQARARRQKVEREANFYGAMDGASKFVRGDAVAALIITAVNLLGGLAIGVFQKDMDAGDAMRLFALLSIGDGLVTQVPALLISTASGILVTRGASDVSLGEDFGRQLLLKPRALQVTAGFMGIFAFVPGLPTIPLLGLAGGAWMLSRVVVKAQTEEAASEKLKAAKGGAASGIAGTPSGSAKPDTPEAQLHMDMLELELGPALLSLADRNGADLLGRIAQLRKKLAAELGIIIPALRVRDNLSLPGRHYRLKIRNAVVAEHEVHPDKLLAINPGNAKPGMEGIKTQDPAFGLPALWIPSSQRARGETNGYTVVEPVSVLATHLHELLRSNAADLFTRQDVQKLVDRVKENDPGLIKELIPNAINLATLHRVLQGLLRERMPIRDTVTILEVLGDNAGQNKPLNVLIEDVRAALAPAYVGSLLDDSGKLQAVACEPALESRLIQALLQTERGPMLVLQPNQVTALIRRINEDVTAAQKRKLKPVLLCSASLRIHLRGLVERMLPSLPIISYAEIPRRATLEIVAQIPASIIGGESAAIQAMRTAESVPQKA
jgi:flagellar biosynthesis protein FlhA